MGVLEGGVGPVALSGEKSEYDDAYEYDGTYELEEVTGIAGGGKGMWIVMGRLIMMI